MLSAECGLVNAHRVVVDETPHPALGATFPLTLTPHILWGPLPKGEGGKPPRSVHSFNGSSLVEVRNS
jgi:hypothetical protein